MRLFRLAKSLQVRIADDFLSLNQASYNPEPFGIEKLFKRALIQEGEVPSILETERCSKSFKCRQVLGPEGPADCRADVH